MKTDIIYCGECVKVMEERIFSDSIDLTVTSPPYDDLREYNGYTFDFEPIATELWRVTKPGGAVVWVVADATVNGSETGTSFRQALGFMELGFRLHDTMIYQADKPPMNANRYQAEFEFMFVLSKGKPKTFNPLLVKSKLAKKYTSKTINRNKDGEVKTRHHTKPVGDTKIKGNVWRYEIGYMKTSPDKVTYNHPAPFPEALARDHIISWSNPGDIVFDPMCGSGTTLKMAVEQGRQYIGIDISQEYCDLAQQRVSGARVPLPGLEISINTQPRNIQATLQETK